MILYKYVSFDTGRKILESGNLRFSDARSFNDPFDTPTYPPEEGLAPLQSLVANVHLQMKESIWAANTGVLSLTRTPTNPLMWAHYADQHRGMVLGFDVRKSGFADAKSNVVPAQYGSVVYVSARPNYNFVSEFGEPLELGVTHRFVAEHYEKLQRVFLMKALCWAYEEEVRILKCIVVDEEGEHDTPSGRFSISGEPSNEQLRLYKLPAGAIREVYFGIRNYMADAARRFASSRWPKNRVGAIRC